MAVMAKVDLNLVVADLGRRVGELEVENAKLRMALVQAQEDAGEKVEEK